MFDRVLNAALNSTFYSYLPANIYLLEVNSWNTRKSEICSKLTIKTLERRQWCCFGIFIVNFEHILQPFLLFQLLTLNMQMLAGLDVAQMFKLLKFGLSKTDRTFGILTDIWN